MSGAALDPTRLPHWVIYEHPADFPELFIARLWYSRPKPEPTADVIACPELEPLREHFAALGCFKVDRFLGDDPKIVETWFL